MQRSRYVSSFLGLIVALSSLYAVRMGVGKTLLEGLVSPPSPSKRTGDQAQGLAWDRVQDQELRLLKLESDHNLLRNEWSDAQSKFRAIEERVKKRQQRADRQEEEEEVSPELLAHWQGANGSRPTRELEYSPEEEPTDPLEAARAAVFQQRMRGR